MDQEARRLKKNAYQCEWKKRNRDKVNGYARAYAKENRVKVNAGKLKSLRKRRAESPAQFAEYKRRHREKYPDKVKAEYAAWYAQHGAASARRRYSTKIVNDPFHYLFTHARYRAKKLGIAFDLERSDIVVPEICPVLGLKITKGTTGFQATSPSVDRVDPLKGYVRGNVCVISWRANRIKSDSSIAELEAVLTYMKRESPECP